MFNESPREIMPKKPYTPKATSRKVGGKNKSISSVLYLAESCSVASFNSGTNNIFFSSLMTAFDFGVGITFSLLHQCSVSFSLLMQNVALSVFAFLHPPSSGQQSYLL